MNLEDAIQREMEELERVHRALTQIEALQQEIWNIHKVLEVLEVLEIMVGMPEEILRRDWDTHTSHIAGLASHPPSSQETREKPPSS